MSDSLRPEEFAQEVSERIRIVPWRLCDRLMFAGILVFAVVNLILNLLNIVGYRF